MYEWKVRLLVVANERRELVSRTYSKWTATRNPTNKTKCFFAFDRTRSRLGEMSSTKYLSSQWLGAATTTPATTTLELEPALADPWFQLVGGNICQRKDNNDDDDDDDDDDNNNNNNISEEYYQKIFDDFDLNKDGVLDKHEIKAMMTNAFGYKPVDLVVNEMIASIDTDQNGVVDSKEFGALLAELKQHRQQEQTG